VRLQQRGKIGRAERLYRELLKRDPSDVAVLNNLGLLLKQQGRVEEAAGLFRKALLHAPHNPAVLNNLGNVCLLLGDRAAAMVHFERAVEVAPRDPAGYVNLGRLSRRAGDLAAAMSLLKKARLLSPHDPKILSLLGLVHLELGLPSRAEEFLRHALALSSSADLYVNLGSALLEQGRAEEALAAFEAALDEDENHQGGWRNWLLAANYLDFPPGYYRRAHEEWGRRFPLRPRPVLRLEPGEKIRLGYVSADFRRHPVACFLLPLVSHHDRDRFEVFCYSATEREDHLTERFSELAAMRRILGRTDQEAAGMIRKDRIHILVDLSGHTAGSRLPLFALRPAPVQVSYLGYPNTTGLAAVDFRITDWTADPEGSEPLYTETLARLETGFLCFEPVKEVEPADELPPGAAGRVTFASFNNLAKVSDETVRAWAELLQRVEGAELLLKYKSLADPAVRDQVIRRFEGAGLAEAEKRLRFQGFEPDPADHLGWYRKVDVALDTFPYNGTTTTCEALWMGVPVVTLAGARHAGRVGASILERLGLSQWVAGEVEEYVVRAAELARRSPLRGKPLRERFASSSLMDAQGFCREIERCYLAMIDTVSKEQRSRR